MEQVENFEENSETASENNLIHFTYYASKKRTKHVAEDSTHYGNKND